MAGQLIQSKFGTGTGAGTAIAQDANPTSGSTLVVIAFDPTQSTTFGISDTIGNVYTNVASRNGANATTMTVWTALNKSTAANTVTVTATVGADTVAVMVAEVGSLTALTGSTTVPMRAAHITNQANPGTGADAITSSASTNDQCFVLGLGMYELAPASDTIAAGTGFTSTSSGNVHNSGWGGIGFGSAPALLEWKSGVAANSATAATFTDATHGAAGTFYDVMVALDDYPGVGDDLTPGVTSDLVAYNNNWTYLSPTTTNWLQAGSTGAICNNATGGHQPCAYYGVQGTFTADQEVQFVLSAPISVAAMGAGVRLSAGASGPNGYMVWCTTANYNIGLSNNGTFSSLIAGPLNHTFNTGDICVLDIRGTTLTFSVNGSTIKTVTDSTISSGNPGIASNGGNHPSSAISTWRAQSLGTIFSSQTSTTTIGQIGFQVSPVISAQTGNFTAPSLPTESIAVTLQRTAQLVGQSTPTSGGTGASSGGSGNLTWANFIASADGSATAINVYLNTTPGGVPLLYLAIYDSGGNLLASGSVTPTVGLNTCPITPVTLTYGQQYSLAWQSSSSAAVIVSDDGNAPNAAVLRGGNTAGNPPPATLPGGVATALLGLPSIYVTGTTGLEANFLEGQLLNVINVTGQTAAFSEGTITASVSSGASFVFPSMSASFAQGQLFDNISYLLDQGTVIIVGQTATFVEGVVAPSASYNFPAYTLTSVEGTLTTSMSVTLGSLAGTFAEGLISASTGSNFTSTLGTQLISSSEGAIGMAVTPTFPAYTSNLTEGTITFSLTGDFTVSLGAQTAVFVQGVFGFISPTPGTGPPLFIPPTLGKPVTTRTFSWLEMASRAWGSEFRAPDHRIYQFSGGNYKDSTDMGTTGIYSPNLGTPDNP